MWKQAKSMDKWINNMWVDLEDIHLNEMSQSRKDNYSLFPHV